MKKYGLVVLLLIFSRSVFAEGCFFELNNPQDIYFTLNGGTEQVSLPKNTSGPQLIRTYSTSSAPLVTHWNATGAGTTMSVTTSSRVSSTRATKTPGGALLFPIENVSTEGESGFAFAFKVSNGSRSAYITEIGTASDAAAGRNALFSNLTKEQCNEQNWYFTVELWHVDNNYRNEEKLATIKPIRSYYFSLYLPGAIGTVKTYSAAFIYFDSGTSIPVAPTTCNLSINSSTIDFGKLYARAPETWSDKEVILTSNGCSQVGAAQLRILSNGHLAKGFTALGNQLTGDNAAQNILVRFLNKSDTSGNSIKMDIGDSAEGLSCDDESLTFDSDGFINTRTHTVIADIYPPSGKVPTTGDFSTSAVFSVSYY